MSTLILFDSFGIIHRGYHAWPRVTMRGSGRPVGAIGGFWGIVSTSLKAMQARPDDLVGFALDLPTPTWRHEMSAAYKANRGEKDPALTSQMAAIIEMLHASGADVLSAEGYEADDVMATVAFKRHARGQETILVTADKDLLQCLPYARIFGWHRTAMTNDEGGAYTRDVFRETTRADCRERFGVEPEHVATALALIGDTSDNVAGVDGVGPKGAASLIERWGTLEAIIENAAEIPREKIRIAVMRDADQARLALKLVTVSTDVPGLAPVWSTVADIDWPAIIAELGRLDLPATAADIERRVAA